MENIEAKKIWGEEDEAQEGLDESKDLLKEKEKENIEELQEDLDKSKELLEVTPEQNN